MKVQRPSLPDAQGYVHLPHQAECTPTSTAASDHRGVLAVHCAVYTGCNLPCRDLNAQHCLSIPEATCRGGQPISTLFGSTSEPLHSFSIRGSIACFPSREAGDAPEKTSPPHKAHAERLDRRMAHICMTPGEMVALCRSFHVNAHACHVLDLATLRR